MHFANRTEDFGRAQKQLRPCVFGFFSSFLALFAFLDFIEIRPFTNNTHSGYKTVAKNKNHHPNQVWIKLKVPPRNNLLRVFFLIPRLPVSLALNTGRAGQGRQVRRAACTGLGQGWQG